MKPEMPVPFNVLREIFSSDSDKGDSRLFPVKKNEIHNAVITDKRSLRRYFDPALYAIV